MRIALAFWLVIFTALAFGQDVKVGLGGSTKKPALDRFSRILNAADEQIGLQKDYLFDEGDFPRLVQILRIQCDLDQSDYELWTDLIWMYGNLENREMELATAIEYKTLHPSDPEAWYPEAQIYYLKGNFLKVIPLLEASISVGKPHPNSYRLLAQSWRRLGFDKQAIRVWELMLKFYPNDPRAKAQLDRAKSEAAAAPPEKP